MKKAFAALCVFLALTLSIYFTTSTSAQTPKIKLGNEQLMTGYHHLIEGKRIGLVTNQSGVNSQGRSTIDVLAEDKSIKLAALYGPEHGIDGKAKAGEYVKSYVHKQLNIPVYSLYGETRMPTGEMLRDIDILIFDVQDIGARSYTYMSTMNYCMVAAQKYGKQIIVLDRPNPVGGEIVEGPVLEDRFISFVGIDNLPMAHGMTAGELALYFNRKIGANLKVIPMEGYTRKMTYQDTGLRWVQTSPNIPDIDSVFGYMATGLGEGTGIFQADKFKWIGGKGIDQDRYASLLNQAGLPGVVFIAERRGDAGGVRLKITDYHTFNPAKTGIYALAYARSLNSFTVPKSGQTIVMFDKIMGTGRIGSDLEKGLGPQQIENGYSPALSRFREERKNYLIYGYETGKQTGLNGEVTVLIDGIPVSFDSAPYIDSNNRLMVPLRAIAEALGANVQWNSGTRTVTITRQGKAAVFKIDSTTATVNGQAKKMDTSPVIRNDRTMVPVRYVGEYLGAEVKWDPDTRTVTIF
ncbi:MAG: exo-beta-N-acetylmuramidase NamZ domain-containing protein [Bacillota bacterium]